MNLLPNKVIACDGSGPARCCRGYGKCDFAKRTHLQTRGDIAPVRPGGLEAIVSTAFPRETGRIKANQGGSSLDKAEILLCERE